MYKFTSKACLLGTLWFFNALFCTNTVASTSSNSAEVQLSDSSSKLEAIAAGAGGLACLAGDVALWLAPDPTGITKAAAVVVGEACLEIISGVVIAGVATNTVNKYLWNDDNQNNEVDEGEVSLSTYTEQYHVLDDGIIECNISTNFANRDVPAIACWNEQQMLQVYYTEEGIFDSYLTTSDEINRLAASELDSLFHPAHDEYNDFTDLIFKDPNFLTNLESAINERVKSKQDTVTISNHFTPGSEDIHNTVWEECKSVLYKDRSDALDQRNCAKDAYNKIKNSYDLNFLQYTLGYHSPSVSSLITGIKECKAQKLALHNDGFRPYQYASIYANCLKEKNSVFFKSAYPLETYQDIDEQINHKLNSDKDNIISFIIWYEIQQYLSHNFSLVNPEIANEVTRLSERLSYLGNSISSIYTTSLSICRECSLADEDYYSLSGSIMDTYIDMSQIHLQAEIFPLQSVINEFVWKTLKDNLQNMFDENSTTYADDSTDFTYEINDNISIVNHAPTKAAVLIYEAEDVRIEVHVDANQQRHFYYVYADGTREEIAIIEDFFLFLTYEGLQKMLDGINTDAYIDEINQAFSPGMITDTKNAFNADIEFTEYADDLDGAVSATMQADNTLLATYERGNERLVLKNNQIHATLYWSPHSHYFDLENPRYISRGFVAEYGINLEIYLALQRIKSGIQYDSPYTVTLNGPLIDELMLAGNRRTASQNNPNSGDNNKGSKFQKLTSQDGNPNQATNNQQTTMIKTGTMQQKPRDNKRLVTCRSALGYRPGIRNGFIHPDKARIEGLALREISRTHKFACFSIAVSSLQQAAYTFRPWNIGVPNVTWGIDCNMYDRNTGVFRVIPNIQDTCPLTEPTQMINVFILVPRNTTTREVSFARAFSGDRQIKRFYGLTPYANNLPGMDNMAAGLGDPNFYMQITNTERMFDNASNLTKVEMVMDYATNTSFMFRGATAFSGQSPVAWTMHRYGITQSVYDALPRVNGRLRLPHGLTVVNPTETWDTSNLEYWKTTKFENMENMFYRAINFNQNINTWNTSAVTNMQGMFAGAQSFDQPLNLWDTRAVTNMQEMFSWAASFDQPLNLWDTRLVTNMQGMFQNNGSFDQPLDDWDTSSVTDMSNMFYMARIFNQPLSSWYTGEVTNMDHMFAGAFHFNQDLSGWDVGRVTSCQSFYGQSRLTRNDLPLFYLCNPH